MDKLRTGVFILFVLVVPVSCKEAFFTEPVICYFLDGILVVYCIIATALYFREKYSHRPAAVFEEKSGIYQELQRPNDADPYQVLEPVKRKIKVGKKKKSTSAQPEDKDKDPYESLNPSPPPPPLSPC
uniref:T-cell surface glycoprotein CD3 zeta chain-like isoform X2 n=1 Tax=Monopterus albus TaxID=43700 RepID=UPI0009B49BF3|nr:T-cell surface glycoprotein CD3 zeta chain-like isoform X2 [Monopterus albus]